MPDLQCPACKSIYPEGTRDCPKCVRPGAPMGRSIQRPRLVPVEQDAVAKSLDTVAADRTLAPTATVRDVPPKP